MSARVLVLAGYGLNCEEETLHAFQYNGIDGKIVHVNDMIESPDQLENTEILVIPGGFSYGDDTGSGNAFGQKVKLSLHEHILKFIQRDTLILGICNGCQILSNMGLVPALNDKYGKRQVAVTYNSNARYQCRWIDVKITSDISPWLSNIDHIHIPVAHGEGRFMMDDNTHKTLIQNKQIAIRYIKPDGQAAKGAFPYNPNGSMDDIAAITDTSGRILAMMPHPERGMFTWQRDDFHEIKDKALRNGDDVNECSDGMQIFKNASEYFK